MTRTRGTRRWNTGTAGLIGAAAIVFVVSLAAYLPAGSSPYAQGNEPGPARPRAFAAGANFRIFPGPVTQTEPFIVPHPLNDSILFVAANTINLNTGFISEGIYVSTDGGIGWHGSDTCTGAPIQFHRGDPGIAIDRNGIFLITRLGFSPGLYAHSSTDRGSNWSAQKQVASNDQDRADLATDADPGSPYDGRTYASWVKFAPPYPVMLSFTTDGGFTWSVPAQINAPPQRCQGADIEVGPGGTLYVCWAGVGSVSPFAEEYVGFARSTDGGSSWDVTENAFAISGIQGSLPQKANIRVNGLPRLAVDGSGGGISHGNLYVVTTEKNLAPAGADPDIILRSSSDSGRTWSAGSRVNQDALNNGKIQYFPAPHVDRWGGVNILYYSDEPTTGDSSAIFLARSTSMGTGWTAVEIGDHRFRPLPIGGLGAGYQGDNITLTSVGDTLRPVWTDNFTGVYQLWTSAVSIPPGWVPAEEHPGLPSDYRLEQNFPNPFNPSTVIRFTLPRAEEVLLTVFDLSGKVVATIVSGRLPAGNHSATFSAAGKGMGSGIYFYQLTVGEYSGTRKLVLMK